ncbi:hypothetical protein IPZ58_26780 [Streptomyces roseoverticillatus]|uniref:S1 family peptidase n=1 Tax=Streptomyces roseoverticillatus TaxID=66429 RepID=UPI001F2AB4A9|nr:S1 family peptidase [Streptomyces roseoverticillatus]MCF3105169.1 hypothetical protein [Streptomyces roseoverticillatus]
MPSVAELVAVKQRVEQQFLDQPNVTGIDVGYKEVGGELTDQIAVRVHVARKTDDIPSADRVPERIDGFVTDVVERVYELQVASRPVDMTLQADTRHVATLKGGVSMGPSRVIGGFVFSGTLGAVVIDNATRAKAALTNFHVAAVDSDFQVGDRMVQPSLGDTGVAPQGEFGALLRATLSTAVDGALISIDPGRAASCEVDEIGPVRGTKKATLGMAVRKRGRTTGLTHGSVDGVSGSVQVDYGDGLGVRTLKNQVSIKADASRNALFSDHGDSGSVIVDDDGFVVALLFAGAGDSTSANPIAAVLSELNISMCTSGPQAAPGVPATHLKSAIKDATDHKEVIKEKELVKELTKDKEFKEFIKDKEIVKELSKDTVLDSKTLKDVIDNLQQVPPPVGPPHPGPLGGQSSLEQRLGAVEAQLTRLGSFIEPGQRPDLRGAALSGAPQPAQDGTEELRAELERQVAEAVAAKSEFDTPMA